MADINLAISKINEICEKADIDLKNNGLLESEILECEFISQVRIQKAFRDSKHCLNFSSHFDTYTKWHHRTTTVPKIQCTKFSGEEVGKFEFKIF